MKNIAKLFVAFVFAVFITGCVTTEKEYIYINKWHHIPVDEKFLKPCEVVRPISKDSYMAMTKDEREVALGKMIIESNGAIRKCNNQIQSIKEQDKRNAQIIEDKNKEIQEKTKK